MDINRELKYVEDLLRLKASKSTLENSDFTMKGNITFRGTNTFKSAPTVDGVSMKTVERSLTESVSNSSVLDRMKFQRVGSTIVGDSYSSQFGRAVEISADGTRIIVGASYQDDGETTDAGAVYVYDYSEGSWSRTGQIIRGTSAEEKFGSKVGMSPDGSTIAIVTNYYTTTPLNTGRVKVYRLVESTWTQIGSDIDGEESDYLGFVVNFSTDGNVMVISNLRKDGESTNQGAVQIYQYSDSEWTSIGTIYGNEGDQCFGSDITPDGTKIACGFLANDDFAPDAGKVRLLEYDGTSWNTYGEILGTAENDSIGYQIKLSSNGNIVAVSSTAHNSYTGLVRVFQRNGTNFSQLGSDIVGTTNGDQFGFNIGLSSNGKTLIVGCPYYDTPALDTGLARVYQYNGSDWQQICSDLLADEMFDQIGYDVDISADGTRIIVGSIYDNPDRFGSVNIYDIVESRIVPTSAPINPVEGMMYVDSDNDRLYVYNGSSWVYKTLT